MWDCHLSTVGFSCVGFASVELASMGSARLKNGIGMFGIAELTSVGFAIGKCGMYKCGIYKCVIVKFEYSFQFKWRIDKYGIFKC